MAVSRFSKMQHARLTGVSATRVATPEKLATRLCDSSTPLGYWTLVQ
jgi:hypothetical protein